MTWLEVRPASHCAAIPAVGNDCPQITSLRTQPSRQDALFGGTTNLKPQKIESIIMSVRNSNSPNDANRERTTGQEAAANGNKPNRLQLEPATTAQQSSKKQTLKLPAKPNARPDVSPIIKPGLPSTKPAVIQSAPNGHHVNLGTLRLPAITPSSANGHVDLDSLRLTQDFSVGAILKRVSTVIRCRKPNKCEFVRVREGAEWHLDTYMVDLGISQGIYLIPPGISEELAKHRTRAHFLTTINRQAELFLWPVKALEGDRSNSWIESNHCAVQLAYKQWTQVSTNTDKSVYEATTAEGELPEPQWPDFTFQAIIDLCFASRVIDSMDHPVVRQLRGLE